MKIKIEDKEYNVLTASTKEEKEIGLQKVKSMDNNEGMLFIYNESEDLCFWMKDTKIPLDIIFIDEDLVVISVKQGKPLSEELIEEEDVKYVLELNINSGIEEGDELSFEDLSENSMHILDSNCESQMELKGGERIFSRKNTKILIDMSKKCDKSKKDSNYKRLGKQLFKYLKIQDINKPEFVKLKKD